MLFVALIACALAKDIVCETGMGSFSVYPVGKCMNAIDGSSAKLKKDGDKYKITTYAKLDCKGDGKEEDYTLESGCKEGDKPDYIAFFNMAKDAKCEDKDDYPPSPFFQGGCHKMDNGFSVKYEVDDGETKFTQTIFPNEKCEDDKNKQVEEHKCGECSKMSVITGTYECGAMGIASLLALVLVLLF